VPVQVGAGEDASSLLGDGRVARHPPQRPRGSESGRSCRLNESPRCGGRTDPALPARAPRGEGARRATHTWSHGRRDRVTRESAWTSSILTAGVER
jgi:hypothetical protein